MGLLMIIKHRIIGESEAVQFMVTIKNILEEPARIMLQDL